MLNIETLQISYEAIKKIPLINAEQTLILARAMYELELEMSKVMKSKKRGTKY